MAASNETGSGERAHDGGIADLVPAQVPAVAAMMARAFDDDPVWCHVLSDPATRARRFAAMFTTLVRGHLRAGDRVRVADGGAAMAMWGPPSHTHFSIGENLRQLPGMLRAFGVGGAQYLGDLQALERLHAEWHHRPHWYLAFLGADPDRQRRGLGGRLIEDTLSAADEQGLGSYLLSSKEANLAYYRRHRFEVVSMHTFRDGPTAWGMWREPRPDT